MAFFDLPLEELKKFYPDRVENTKFDDFWASTLQETRKFPLEVTFTPVDYGVRVFETYDVTFNGFNGQPIKGWFILPKNSRGKLPCVVEYIGYGGGRSFPHQWLIYPSAGYAHFVMDTRGQGSTWSNGDTPDVEPEGSNSQHPGFMTRGILKPETYYYRRVFTDAVRAVEAARSHPAVDVNRIAITGGSQGGGITVAVSGLVPDLSAVMPDVPYLCCYRRATQLVNTYPYSEIGSYLKVHRDKVETVFDTLSFFDGVNFSTRANAPALFSVGLMDDICPPSTVYAAYNYYKGSKEIRIYEYNNHEGGGPYHVTEKVNFLHKQWD